MSESTMKVVMRIGDVCAEDHGGGAIIEDEYGHHVEYTYGLETEHPGEDRYGDEVGDLIMDVYRVPLDESAWEMIRPHGYQTELWEAIAETCGQDFDDVVALAKSKDPIKISGALEMYANHWGWINLDHEPMRLTYREIEERWST